jgi:uncharacterized protein
MEVLIIINKVHLFLFKEYKFAYDVGTGLLHLVDDIAYDIINAMIVGDTIGDLKVKYSEEDICEARQEIEGLIKEKKIFSDPPTYPKDYNLGKTDLKALCLNIAHDCELRCRYCFASTGGYGGNRNLMTIDIAKKSVDFLLDNSGNRKNLDIDFFGGEPLLNKDVLIDTIHYGNEQAKEKGKRITYTVTTNCLSLDDDLIEFFNNNNINLVLSLDGREEIHDYHRETDGTGRYKDIINKIVKLAISRTDTSYYVRGTYTAKNLDFSFDVIHLYDLGIKNISIEPVILRDDHPLALREEHISHLLLEYDKLSEHYLDCVKKGSPYLFFHFALDLDKSPCFSKRLTGCGAGREYLAVTPEGNLYPCHQFVGQEVYSLGNVTEENYKEIKTGKIAAQFDECHIFSKDSCPDCWARFLCSGGCHANGYSFNQSILKPYEIGCLLQKKRIENSLAIKAILKGGLE